MPDTLHPQLHLHWGADALRQRLHGLVPGLAVEVVGQIGSTNTELADRARARLGGARADDAARAAETCAPHVRRQDDQTACLLVAEQQTQGRGRQGKRWHSGAPGSALMFSLALPLAPADWSGLSLAVGLAIAEALDPPPQSGAPDAGHAPRLLLKWPNDLLLRDAACLGRKMGGILIETVSQGGGRVAVIGVGLNVLPLPPDPAAEPLPWGRACVQELDPGATAPLLLARVVPPLVQAVLRFEREGFAPLAARWARRDLLHGHTVATTLAEAPTGVADGVDAQGVLWLRVGEGVGEGRRLPVSSGEVSLRRPSIAALGDAPC